MFAVLRERLTKVDLCSLDALTWFSISAGCAKCTFLMRFTLRFIRNLRSHSHLNAKSPRSLHEKYKALKEIQNGLSKKEAASKFNVALNTVSTWLNNREDYQCCHKGKKPKTKNLKGGSYDRLDQAVYKYFLNVRGRNIPVNGPMLKEKAMSCTITTNSRLQGI